MKVGKSSAELELAMGRNHDTEEKQQNGTKKQKLSPKAHMPKGVLVQEAPYLACKLPQSSDRKQMCVSLEAS